MGMVPLFFDLDHTLWDFVSNSRKTLREGYEAFALYDLGVTDFSEWIRVSNARTTGAGKSNKFGKERQGANGQNDSAFSPF